MQIYLNIARVLRIPTTTSDAPACSVGDIVAIIANGNPKFIHGAPILGVTLDTIERYRQEGIPFQCISFHRRNLARIPSQKEPPELEWIDDKTPILYYGE